MDRHLLNILFGNWTEKCGAIMRFVQIDTSNGRYRSRYLHIAGHVQRSSAYWPAYSTSEDDLL